ncbi:MAG: hypothetical protein R3B45_14010 [Bdellovibrionota bacterium]
MYTAVSSSSRLAPKRTSNPLKILGRVDVSFPTTSQTLESQRCHGFKNYPQCTSSTPPVILKPFLAATFKYLSLATEMKRQHALKFFKKFQIPVILTPC